MIVLVRFVRIGNWKTIVDFVVVVAISERRNSEMDPEDPVFRDSVGWWRLLLCC